MERLGKITTLAFTLALSLFFVASAQAQCTKFDDAAEGSDALAAYSTYRTYVKDVKAPADLRKISDEDRNIVFEYWEKAYNIAPAADGKRPTIWRDGRTFYKYKMMNETDEAKRKEYFEKVMKLYDEETACFTSNNNESIQLGRKAFDMFYGLGAQGQEIRSSYDATLTVLESAVDKGGNNTEYITFVPYANVVVYQFTNDKMDKLTARGIYQKLNAIADYNIENNKTLGAYYKQAKESMNGTFATIENNIFDCEYFKDKLAPEYKEKGDDPTFLKEAITVLKRQGCEESDTFLAELESKWSVYAAEENARRQAEFEANNPNVMAKKLYDEGDYKGAIAKYEEAIGNEEDPSKQASYHFSIASIQFRKLKQYSAARSSAYKAAKLREGWGRPYLLIGDMYASSVRSCGKEPWQQRMVILAAVDKYAYARSIDSDTEVQEEANRKIGKYASQKPEKGDVFMAGYKDGASYKIGCWIGESVKIRTQ